MEKLLLRKDVLTKEQATEFYPDNSLYDGSGYTYYIEVSAFTALRKKTYTHVSIQVIGERGQGNYVMRNICMTIPQGKAYLDKPMRSTQRDLIYSQAKTKLLEKALRILPANHPYTKTLEAM